MSVIDLTQTTVYLAFVPIDAGSTHWTVHEGVCGWRVQFYESDGLGGWTFWGNNSSGAQIGAEVPGSIIGAVTGPNLPPYDDPAYLTPNTLYKAHLQVVRPATIEAEDEDGTWTELSPIGHFYVDDGAFDIEFTTLAIPVAPSVIMISPNSGIKAGFDPVTITGTGFVEGMTVHFDLLPLTGVEVVSDTEITAFTPAHPTGFVDVWVTWPDDTVDSLVDGFQYGALSTAPRVEAGPSVYVTGPPPKQAFITATVIPGENNGTLSYRWVQENGPVDVVIINPNSINTALVFPSYAVGQYTFRLEVTTSGDSPLISYGLVTAFILETVAPQVH